jgi:hypothetical protein
MKEFDMAHETNESVPPPPAGTWAIPVAPGYDSVSHIPEEVLDDWRWVFKGRQEGLLGQYVGQHIAVVNQRVVASDSDLRRLRRALVEKHHLDPDRVVTAYMD